jgi:transcriptional regulator with PAS, ATPase and Fis domain
MSRPAEGNHSVTARSPIPSRPGAEEVPTLLVVGSAGRVAPAARRVIPFGQGLLLGRGAPESVLAGPEPGVVTWLLDDAQVSRQHVRIEGRGGVYTITDLGSRNGTSVDGEAIGEPVKLRDGAIIFVGTHVAVFRLLSTLELAAIAEEQRAPFGPVATASPALARTCQLLRKLAPSDTEILLTGETGVGKEVYAQALHEASGRKGRLVAINCAALPAELVESELFGYVRGAHSQAKEGKRGLFEEAEGGTLLLDEIGDMPIDMQAKLLRFLQDRELTPLGATRGRHIDVRIIGATSRPVAGSGSGVLRPDLAARFGPEPHRLPTLRQRPEDIGALTAHFLAGHALSFELQAYQALTLHAWPGNVRELRKTVGQATLLAEPGGTITLEHLPAVLSSSADRRGPGARPGRPPPTREELQATLERFSGNMLKVARALDRQPPLIYRWCKRYQLDPNQFRDKE